MPQLFDFTQRFFPVSPSRFLTLIALALAADISCASPVIHLENNQPFRIRMPVRVRGFSPGEGNWITGERHGLQITGHDAVFIADISPGAHKTISFISGRVERPNAFALKPATNGVALVYSGEDLGKLSWDIFLKPVNPAGDDAIPTAPPENFDVAFDPLPLTFQNTARGPVFDTWTAETTKAGLKLKLELVAYGDGFLDVNAHLINQSADPRAKVYAAVICRWEQPPAATRSFCYDNRIAPLGDPVSSPFRSGPGRYQFAQRGVDWVRNIFQNGVATAWLNDFAPSFTVLDNSSNNAFSQPRFEGANLPQLGQEVQIAGPKFYSITEIARANIKSYRDRLADNVLPAVGEGVTFSSRVVLGKKPISDRKADDMLVGYTSYNEQRQASNGIVISFGVPSVRFGTSYFPYSTLGENFDRLRLPGMDRDAFWPLAADTVLRWREFADDIRRDLRIAAFMGFQVIRLHHLELLAPIPRETRQEYLDFLFGELRHLKLHALVDVYASDAAIVELLHRYGDVIEGVELENEILIWGIPLDRPPLWKQTYAAIKQAAPGASVNLTGYNNTGIFNRLESLGVPFDRVGLHSYVESLDAIPTARGYALALGSFCTKLNKPPVITEWNWRQLTRMTPEARAKIYPPIFENALATRAIPEMHQFQFNETLAPNPRTGRGNILRHYELLNLSRRPKLEALELVKLIKKYSATNDTVRTLDVPRVVVNLDRHGAGEAILKITNTGTQTQRLIAGIESSADFKATLRKTDKLVLKPGQSKSISVSVKTADETPGFYHCFLRLEAEDGSLRYGWIEARMTGAPQLDTTRSASNVAYPLGPANELAFDFAKPFAVVYGQAAPVLEVETAITIASTLESATGRPVEAYQLADLPNCPEQSRNLILVGTRKSNALIAQLQARLPVAATGFVTRVDSSLIVSGEDALAVEHAGIDLLLRWWMHAKDSAARRVGLVKKSLPRGGDATKLP